MCLRMRHLERRQYQAASLIQALWKGFHTRKEFGEELAQYRRGIRFITAYAKGKLQKTRKVILMHKSATLVQKFIRGFRVYQSVRFVKVDNLVAFTL